MSTRPEKCPTCGSDVLVRGEGDTHYYEPCCTDAERYELTKKNIELKKQHKLECIELLNEVHGELSALSAGGDMRMEDAHCVIMTIYDRIKQEK